MRFFVMNLVNDLDQDAKISKAVVVAGGSLSVGSVMEWLPSILGIIGTIIAIILSIFLIYVHYKRNKREQELHDEKMKKFRSMVDP